MSNKVNGKKYSIGKKFIKRRRSGKKTRRKGQIVGKTRKRFSRKGNMRRGQKGGALGTTAIIALATAAAVGPASWLVYRNEKKKEKKEKDARINARAEQIVAGAGQIDITDAIRQATEEYEWQERLDKETGNSYANQSRQYWRRRVAPDFGDGDDPLHDDDDDTTWLHGRLEEITAGYHSDPNEPTDLKSLGVEFATVAPTGTPAVAPTDGSTDDGSDTTGTGGTGGG